MADEYRRMLDRKTGKGGGGVRCDCCNRYRGKNKRKLNRQARRVLKRSVASEIADAMDAERP